MPVSILAWLALRALPYPVRAALVPALQALVTGNVARARREFEVAALLTAKHWEAKARHG